MFTNLMLWVDFTQPRLGKDRIIVVSEWWSRTYLQGCRLSRDVNRLTTHSGLVYTWYGHWDGGRHAGHSGRHAGRTATGCAGRQGHRNTCSALPTTAQVQRHTLLHQREWWHQMCPGGALPEDAAGHDSSPHDGQQDQVFRGRSAGSVAHL